MREKGVKLMNNITMEQREKAFEDFINSDPFNNAIETIANHKISYYDWIKQYILNGSKDKTIQSVNDGIDHIYKCMLLDDYVDCNNSSMVYFIRNEYNGLLKIGKTNNLQRRINEIENCFNFLGMDTQKITVEAISYCPFGMNNSQVESYYHNLYKDKRIKGEWFDISKVELFNDLDIYTIINGVLVSIEDITIFSKGVKHAHLLEENEKELKRKIRADLFDKYDSFFGVFSHKWMSRPTNDKISSKDMYEYILSLEKDEDLVLENKILRKIKEILKEVA